MSRRRATSLPVGPGTVQAKITHEAEAGGPLGVVRRAMLLPTSAGGNHVPAEVG